MTETCQQLETALIGAILTSPEKIIQISDKVKPTDFVTDKAMAAFVTIIDEYRKTGDVNIVSISSRVPELGMYLAAATHDAYPPGAVKFAEDIAYRAKTRRIKAGLEAASKCANPEEMLSQAVNIYHHEMSVGKKDPGIKSVLGRVNKKIIENKKQGRVGYSTGFRLHDSLYFRYLPGHIWCVGGFTSVGKTAVMVQKVCNMLSSGEGASVVLISTEMTESQVVSRIISNFTGIHSMRILSGNFHDAEEEDKVLRIQNLLKDAPLQIYDDIYELEDIETAFRKAKMQGGVNVGFIDYIQNCRWSGAKSEYQEQSGMAKRFQTLAKDTESTVVCLSQVSNDVGRGNTDQLEFKGAGEWAAVSDLGVMLQKNKIIKHRLRYSIKKNRHGALGECYFDFKDVYTRLEEVDIDG
jgi:replicative DNA helicase